MKISMKWAVSGVLAFFMLSALHVQSQDKGERASPLRTATAKVNGGDVTISYSAPSVKGRKIWGDLVPYNKVWRTGANEATTITFEKNAKVNGKSIPAGKYSIFTIPAEDQWILIFNSVWDQWGAYNYDETKDVLRITVMPTVINTSKEELTFSIDQHGHVIMAWETAEVHFRVE